MMITNSKYATMAPMKYYQPLDYASEKAQNMINNFNDHYIATLKSDGEWCRIIKDENGDILAQSRGISKITGKYGDKTLHIPHIIKEFQQLPNGTVLLGELCFNDITSTSKDVGTILRCLPQKAIQRQLIKPLYFKCFDCLQYDGKQLEKEDFEKRFSILTSALYRISTTYISQCVYVTNNFDDFLADIINRGGEGIVIHSKDYKYAPDQRPAWTTLKVKKTTGDIEVPVVAFIEPQRLHAGEDNPNWQYIIDGVQVTKPYYYGWKNGVVINHNDNKVSVTSGLTDEDREWLATSEASAMLSHGTLIAAISGMEITPDSIRHPRLVRLRTDVQ